MINSQFSLVRFSSVVFAENVIHNINASSTTPIPDLALTNDLIVFSGSITTKHNATTSGIQLAAGYVLGKKNEEV